MKNIVCPISKHQIPEHLPRVTAFFVISLLIAYLITGYIPIIIFVGIDFFIRGFNKSKFSLIHFLANTTSQFLGLKSQMIGKSPKLFAARLGGVMSLIIILFHISGLLPVSNVLAAVLISLSTLECVMSVCVGCYIYSWIILPWFSRT